MSSPPSRSLTRRRSWNGRARKADEKAGKGPPLAARFLDDEKGAGPSRAAPFLFGRAMELAPGLWFGSLRFARGSEGDEQVAS